MDEKLNDLISIMWEQVKVINLFRDLGESKTPALVKGKYEELERIIKAEELLIVEMGHLERQRQEKSHLIARSMGVPVEEMTLTRLRESFAGCAEELDEIKDQFLITSRELGELNQLNNELIEQSLRHLDYTVQLLTEVDENTSYGQCGRESNIDLQESSRIFDRWA